MWLFIFSPEGGMNLSCRNTIVCSEHQATQKYTKPVLQSTYRLGIDLTFLPLTPKLSAVSYIDTIERKPVD